MDWLEFLALGLAADGLASEEEWQRERLEREKADLEREVEDLKKETDAKLMHHGS